MTVLKRIWRWLSQDLEMNVDLSFHITDWQFTIAHGGFEVLNWQNHLLFGHLRNANDEQVNDDWWEGFALLGYQVTCDEIVFHFLYFKFVKVRTD